MNMRGLCFDLDGTLIDSARDGMSRVFKVAKKRGLFVNADTENRLRSMWGKDPITIIKTLWPEENQRLFFEEWENLDIAEPHQAFPGTKKALEKLSKRFYMSIVTNRRYRTVPAQLEHNDIDKFFGLIITPDYKDYKKPDPRIMQLLFKDHFSVGILPDDIILIGDTIEGDWNLAKAVGMDFYAVTSGGIDTKERFLAEGVPEDHILDSVADLPRVLIE